MFLSNETLEILQLNFSINSYVACARPCLRCDRRPCVVNAGLLKKTILGEIAQSGKQTLFLVVGNLSFSLKLNLEITAKQTVNLLPCIEICRGIFVI